MLIWGGSRAPGLIPILEYRLNLNYLNIFWLFHYIVRSKNEGLCLAYPLFQVDDEIKQRQVTHISWTQDDTFPPVESGRGKNSKMDAAAKLLQSCLTLCNPIDGSPPGSPFLGILQARTPEWVAIAFSNAWKWKVKVKSLSRVWLCDSMDCSLPSSSVHGIFQARILEWAAISFLCLEKQG